jgi:hypothetical protein
MLASGVDQFVTIMEFWVNPAGTRLIGLKGNWKALMSSVRF